MNWRQLRTKLKTKKIVSHMNLWVVWVHRRERNELCLCKNKTKNAIFVLALRNFAMKWTTRVSDAAQNKTKQKKTFFAFILLNRQLY